MQTSGRRDRAIAGEDDRHGATSFSAVGSASVAAIDLVATGAEVAAVRVVVSAAKTEVAAKGPWRGYQARPPKLAEKNHKRNNTTMLRG